jgi:hypothetical protein
VAIADATENRASLMREGAMPKTLLRQG